jgi:ribonuclease R
VTPKEKNQLPMSIDLRSEILTALGADAPASARRRPLTLKDLLSQLGVHDGKLKTVKRELRELVREGLVERDENRRFRASRVGQTVDATYVVDEDNRPWVELQPPGARGRPSERLRLQGAAPANLAGGARVSVELVAARRGTAARLVSVISAPAAVRLGTFRRLARAEFVDPIGARPNDPTVLLDVPHPELEDGALVEYALDEATSSPVAPRGRIVAVLGRPGDRPTEIRRLELEHGLARGFPDAVEREAQAFGHEVPDAERARRVDLRGLDLVTIDGVNARDFDDAVYAERTDDGGYRLIVAIADVAFYVRPGSPLDDEALARATSTYFPDRVYPMLPEALSNELCSLKPDVDRLCMVAELALDADGARVGTKLYRAVMRSKARLTYDAVADALDGRPGPAVQPLLPRLLVLYKVAQLLLRRRLVRGAIDLDLPEAELVFGPDGLPIDSVRRARNDAHRLIEDLMLAANEAVAAWFEEHELPTVYRIHEDPDPERLAAFVELCEQLGITTKMKKSKLRPKHVAELLAKLDEHPAGKPLHALLLRSLAQARYDAENVGHFGLAADQYLHFTSPIRRYPDLLVHRLLMGTLEDGRPPHDEDAIQKMAAHCSARERAAALAERAAKDLDRAYVALSVMGKPLSGVVTGIQTFGVFVATENPYVEGLVPISMLGDDYFEPDAHNASLVGRRTGRRIPLGLPVKVEIVRVDLERRQVELAPVLEEDEDAPDDGDRPARPEHPLELFGSRAPAAKRPSFPRRGDGRDRPRADANGERARAEDRRGPARDERRGPPRDERRGPASGARGDGARGPASGARGDGARRGFGGAPLRDGHAPPRRARPDDAPRPALDPAARPAVDGREAAPTHGAAGADTSTDRTRFTIDAIKARLRADGRLPAEGLARGGGRRGGKGGGGGAGRADAPRGRDDGGGKRGGKKRR